MSVSDKSNFHHLEDLSIFIRDIAEDQSINKYKYITDEDSSSQSLSHDLLIYYVINHEIKCNNRLTYQYLYDYLSKNFLAIDFNTNLKIAFKYSSLKTIKDVINKAYTYISICF
jgi:hypothetical protein